MDQQEDLPVDQQEVCPLPDRAVAVLLLQNLRKLRQVALQMFRICLLKCGFLFMELLV